MVTYLDRIKALPPLERLVYFIKERESIRIKRSLGLPAPWTDDPVLSKFRFCNMKRADDRVSQWLLRNWYKPHKDHANTLAAVVLARHFNLPESLEYVGRYVYRSGPPDWTAIKLAMRERKNYGNVFNAAYMIRGVGGIDKTGMVIDLVAKPLFASSLESRVVHSESMEKTHECLRCFWGMGSFLAGQVVADLRWALSGSWRDRNTWAPIGPGSRRGMNRVQGRATDSTLSQEGFSNELTELVRELRTRVNPSTTSRMEAMDFQNCLCEFDKMERALWEEGRPKQLYRGAR